MKESWLVEKSEYAAQDAAQLVDLLKELSLPEGVMERLSEELHPMLYNLTKIVASANRADGSWNSGVAQSILADGSDAFRRFMGRVRELSTGKGGFVSVAKIQRARLYPLQLPSPPGGVDEEPRPGGGEPSV